MERCEWHPLWLGDVFRVTGMQLKNYGGSDDCLYLRSAMVSSEIPNTTPHGLCTVLMSIPHRLVSAYWLAGGELTQELW